MNISYESSFKGTFIAAKNSSTMMPRQRFRR